VTVAQKWAAGLIAIGMVTALVLPGRQTVPVINAGRKLVTGSESTAITGRAG
jgi:hypothetical protein